jgi:dephospho-CoA kinase
LKAAEVIPGMKTKIVGITGTIASGKSLVGKLLEEQHVPVLDTDHIGHFVQAHDEAVRAALRQRFGSGIFNDIGELDRKKLGQIVFSDAEARQDLNKIVHPAIIRECRRLIAQHSDEPLVAVLVPLLFEAGLAKQYDEIWTVTASDTVVRERLKARDGISDEDADKRLKAQFSQQEKIAGSDHVIDNSGTADDTRRQVLDLLKRF